MAMIKCPECRHHISSMARTCPECGASIDPVWAAREAEKELKKLEEVPFTVEVGAEPEAPADVETPVEEETPVEPEAPVAPETPAETPVEEETPQAKEEEPAVEPQPEKPTPVPPAETAKTPSKGNRKWIVVLVVLLGLLIGGLYFYDYRAEQAREQHAYEMLKDCSNPDFYEDFIIRYPKSEHTPEVRERLKVVAAQQIEWQNLIASGTRTDLQRFASMHPTSPYAKVALSRIDSLDWTEAKATRSLEAVTRYMTMHPDGYFIDQAETMRQTLERQREEAEAALRDSLARTDSVAATPAN